MIKNILGYKITKDIEDATLPKTNHDNDLPRTIIDMGLTKKLANNILKVKTK